MTFKFYDNPFSGFIPKNWFYSCILKFSQPIYSKRKQDDMILELWQRDKQNVTAVWLAGGVFITNRGCATISVGSDNPPVGAALLTTNPDHHQLQLQLLCTKTWGKYFSGFCVIWQEIPQTFLSWLLLAGGTDINFFVTFHPLFPVSPAGRNSTVIRDNPATGNDTFWIQ